MNVYIENYIKQATLFFPVVEKTERAYLAQLSRSIEDYFSDQDPSSPEAIVEVFGPPQTAVEHYLASTDTQQLVRRIRVRKYSRLCVTVILSLCLMGALLVATYFGFQVSFLHGTDGYEPPLYSASEGISE
ncbi:MAG: DUF6120 family protein [Clostridiales bacterium]|nr:DUF6120 family protein [Clostridiales bacterium]